MRRSSTPYEELEGGLGRAIHYRPERYRAKDLIQEHPLHLRVGGHEAKVDNVAMNGLAFRIGEDQERFEIGSEHEVELLVGDQVAYRGAGRVARQPAPSGTASVRVAMRLVDGFVDIRGLEDQHEELALADDLKDGARRLHDRVPPHYRAAVEEAVHFVQHYRVALERHEQRLRRRGGGDADVDELVCRALESLRQPWLDIRGRAADSARLEMSASLDGHGDTATAMKRYTETVLTTLVRDAPVVERGYAKPLGYPGDYNEMMYIYRNQPEGASAFGRVFHKLACEEPLAAGIRTRKDLMKELQRSEHERVRQERGADETFRVTSLACGPAMEVQEFVREQQDWPGRIQWALIDQEEQALSLAHENVHRSLAGATGEAELKCLYLSFLRMVTEPEIVKEYGPRDFIYAAGLFDYLRPRLARALIANLVDMLRPGGLLAIGNARADERNFWFPELVLDWSLLYRNRDDMIRLAEPVMDRGQVEVMLEPSNAYYFLLFRKCR